MVLMMRRDETILSLLFISLFLCILLTGKVSTQGISARILIYLFQTERNHHNNWKCTELSFRNNGKGLDRS